jgi:hypothetical protein
VDFLQFLVDLCLNGGELASIDLDDDAFSIHRNPVKIPPSLTHFRRATTF